MNDPKLGAVIDLAVLKQDGTIVDYGKYHNMAGNLIIGDYRMYGGSIVFQTRDEIGTTLLDGTYTLSGKRVYRSTGNVLFNAASAMTNGDMVEFTSGFRSYVTSAPSLSVLVLTLSSDVPIPPEQLIRYKTNTSKFGGGYSTSNLKQSVTVAPTFTYSPSAIYKTLSSLFPPTLTPYTLATVTYNFIESLGFMGSYFDINPPIPLLAGDALLFKSFVWSYTYNIGAPRAETACLVGINEPCVVQRTLGLTQDEVQSNNGTTSPAVNVPNRIWLINDANKIPLLSGMPYIPTSGSTKRLPVTCIPSETITAFDYNTIVGSPTKPATYSNNATTNQIIYGLTYIGGTIKQIVFGYSTNNVIYGIIEYDNPVTIPIDKVITIKTSLQAVMEV